MTSTNDGKDVKSNQTSGPKGKTYFIELYKSLEARLSGGGDASERTKHLCEAWRRVHSLCQHSAPSTHTHLLSWLQRHTARTVLQTEWQTPKRGGDRQSLEDAIDSFIAECESAKASRNGSTPWEVQLVARGQWFKRMLARPWDHPVLTLLLNPNGTPPTDDEVLKWLKEERGVTFVMRLHTLVGEKCDDIAVSLAAAVMERVRAATPPIADTDDTKDAPPPEKPEPTFGDRLKEEAGFTPDVWEMITDIEFVLLHKRDSKRCIALAKQTPLLNAYHLIERLQKRLEISPREKRLWKNAKEVAILIAQVVIARCMMVSSCLGPARTALYCCARLLARLLTSRLPATADALANQAPTARHLHTLAQAVDKQLSSTEESMKAYICELYVRAITAGMNELERLKLKTEKEAEARSMEKTLASWFVQLGEVLSRSNRIMCECTLTAFSLHPSHKMYERLDAAPQPAPVVADSDECKEETVKSDFGSWANDSRSQTNFVKTSETLNMKHTQNQANVLSTAIFNEGEALGLSPELCQDIAVLLSGPRVKTLSWDMDRTLLLENCRAYSEQTHGGTRVLTRELKYLNIDPTHYQHLPEERDDDENDPYYGIERGYEHLVPEDPEEIWEDANDPDRTETASSSIEDDFIAPRRKKKNKRVPLSSDEDSDPLSFMAEAKRVQKKKERPHSKERSKERAKKKQEQEPVDPLYIEGHNQNTEIQYLRKDKPKEKKEKKERKKKEKAPKLKAENRNSLSSLVGVKVKNKKKLSKDTTAVVTPVTDSDYDSQRKCSLTSVNSEGNDHYGQNESLFTLDEKSSERKKPHSGNNMGLMKNQDFQSGKAGVKTPSQSFHGPHNSVARLPQSPNTSRQPSPAGHNRNMSPNTQKYNNDVRMSLNKILELRQQHQAMEQKLKQNSPHLQRQPAILRPDIPIQSNISPKAVAIPEIPKSFIKKQQAEQLAELKREVNNILALRKEKKVNQNDSVIHYARRNDEYKAISAPDSAYPSRSGVQHPNTNSLKMTDLVNVPYDRLMAEIAERHDRGNCEVEKPPHTQSQFQPGQLQRSLNVLTPGQRDYQNFLKEYEQMKYAGSSRAIDMSAKKLSKDGKKEILPMSRVVPVVPSALTKPVPKPPQCAKQPTQIKKPDNSLNTFSRLSYMHKNKQTELKSRSSTQKPVCTTSTYQEVSSELDEIIKEHQLAQMRVIQAKNEKFNRLLTKPECAKAKESTKTVDTIESKSHPLLSNLLQSTSKSTYIQQKPVQSTSPPPLVPTTSLCHKDHNDILNLLRQKSNLNVTFHRSTNINSKPSTSKYNNAVSNTMSVTTPSQKQQLRKPGGHEANPCQTSLETKIINIISNTLIKQQTNNAENKNCVKTSSPNLSGTDSVKATEPQVKIKTNGLDQPHVNRDPVKYIPESQKPEWQSVMSDLLRHKTPTRGPNALDVALNKSSFELAFEKSLKAKEVSIFTSMPSTSENDLKSTKQHRKDLPKTATGLTPNVIITNKGLNVQAHVPKKQNTSSDLQKCSNTKKPVIYMNDKNVKQNTSEFTKKIPQDLQRKQFTYAGPKHNDPFISGIPNSDYDLLEELMDDDLRKEIGELSSDDESYNAAAQSFLKPTKGNEKRVSVEFNKPLTDTPKKLTGDLRCLNVLQPPPDINHVPTQKPAVQTTNKTAQMVIETNAVKLSKSVATNKNQNNTNVLRSTNQSAQYITTIPHTQNLTYSNAKITSNNQVIDPNLYISSVSQQAPFQNVMLIGSELVYERYSSIPATAHRNIVPSAYVAVSNVPNMTLYQATQFAAPVANPVIIGSSITVPVISHVSCATIPVQPSVVNNVLQPLQPATIIDTQTPALDPSKIAEASYTKTESVPVIDSPLQNNKSSEGIKAGERKVLSEVQELAVSDKVRIQKIENDINVKKDGTDNEERLKKKRLAIINREINHRCGDEPIALAYSPLPLKTLTVSTEHIFSKAIPLTYTPLNIDEEQKTNDCEEEKLLTQIKDNLQNLSDSINDTRNPVTPDSNESKENKIIPILPCRRILLRSSNKITTKSNVETVDAESLLKKKTKVKLKPETPAEPKVRDPKSYHTKVDDKEASTAKRASKRLRNKTVTIKKQEKRQSRSQHPKHTSGVNLPPSTIECIAQNNTLKSAIRGTNDNDMFFDIEAELLGSKIPKIVLKRIQRKDTHSKETRDYEVDDKIPAAEKTIDINPKNFIAQEASQETANRKVENTGVIVKPVDDQIDNEIIFTKHKQVDEVLEYKMPDIIFEKVLDKPIPDHLEIPAATEFKNTTQSFSMSLETNPVRKGDEIESIIDNVIANVVDKEINDNSNEQTDDILNNKNSEKLLVLSAHDDLKIRREISAGLEVKVITADISLPQKIECVSQFATVEKNFTIAAESINDVANFVDGDINNTLLEQTVVVVKDKIIDVSEKVVDKPADVVLKILTENPKRALKEKETLDTSVPQVTKCNPEYDIDEKNAPAITEVMNGGINNKITNTPNSQTDIVLKEEYTDAVTENILVQPMFDDVNEISKLVVAKEIDLSPKVATSDKIEYITEHTTDTRVNDAASNTHDVPNDDSVKNSVTLNNMESELLSDSKNFIDVQSSTETNLNTIVEKSEESYDKSKLPVDGLICNDKSINHLTEKDNIDLDMTVTCEEVNSYKPSHYTNVKVARNTFNNVKNSDNDVITINDDTEKIKTQVRISTHNKTSERTVPLIEKLDAEPASTLLNVINSNEQAGSITKVPNETHSKLSIQTNTTVDLDNDVVILDDCTTETIIDMPRDYGNDATQNMVDTESYSGITNVSDVTCEKTEDFVKSNEVEPGSPLFNVANSNDLNNLDEEDSRETHSKAPVETKTTVDLDNDVVILDDCTTETVSEAPGSYGNDASPNTVVPVIDSSATDVNETEIIQSYKDGIQIEKLPSNDPLKKCVRVSLPNGRKFKATVYGEVYVTLDTLLTCPSIKSVLLNGLNCKKLYTMNIKQITTVAKNDHSKIISTQLLDNQPTSPKTVETIDLISDDEDECEVRVVDAKCTQTIETEYGKYKIAPIDKDLLTKHQNKLSQKSLIFLKKVDSRPVKTNRKIPNKGKVFPNIEPSILHPYVTGLINDIKNNFTSIDDNAVTNSKLADEIVEIDDSSNDSLDNGQFIENKQPNETLDKLKNVLLKELGVEGAPATKTILRKTRNKNKKMDVQISTPCTSKSGLLRLSAIPTGQSCPFADLDKSEQLKIMNRKSCIRLARCDDLVRVYEQTNIRNLMKQSAEGEQAKESADKPLLANGQDNKPLNNTGDFSIPKDLDTNIVESEAKSASPIIGLSDVIVPLGNKSVADFENAVNQVIPLSCEANWFLTKPILQRHDEHDANRNMLLQSYNPNKSMEEICLPYVAKEMLTLSCEADWLFTKPILQRHDMHATDRNMLLQPNTPNKGMEETCIPYVVNQMLALSCDANWFFTKPILHLQGANSYALIQPNILNQNQDTCGSPNVINELLSKDLPIQTNCVSSLTSLVSKCLQNSYIVHQYWLLRESLTRPPVKSNTNKRKSSSPESSVASKVIKLRDNIVEHKRTECNLSSAVTVDFTSDIVNVSLPIFEDAKVNPDIVIITSETLETTENRFEKGSNNSGNICTLVYKGDKHQLDIRTKDTKTDSDIVIKTSDNSFEIAEIIHEKGSVNSEEIWTTAYEDDDVKDEIAEHSLTDCSLSPTQITESSVFDSSVSHLLNISPPTFENKSIYSDNEIEISELFEIAESLRENSDKICTPECEDDKRYFNIRSKNESQTLEDDCCESPDVKCALNMSHNDMGIIMSPSNIIDTSSFNDDLTMNPETINVIDSVSDVRSPSPVIEIAHLITNSDMEDNGQDSISEIENTSFEYDSSNNNCRTPSLTVHSDNINLRHLEAGTVPDKQKAKLSSTPQITENVTCSDDINVPSFELETTVEDKERMSIDSTNVTCLEPQIKLMENTSLESNSATNISKTHLLNEAIECVDTNVLHYCDDIEMRLAKIVGEYSLDDKTTTTQHQQKCSSLKASDEISDNRYLKTENIENDTATMIAIMSYDGLMNKINYETDVCNKNNQQISTNFEEEKAIELQGDGSESNILFDKAETELVKTDIPCDMAGHDKKAMTIDVDDTRQIKKEHEKTGNLTIRGLESPDENVCIVNNDEICQTKGQYENDDDLENINETKKQVVNLKTYRKKENISRTMNDEYRIKHNDQEEKSDSLEDIVLCKVEVRSVVTPAENVIVNNEVHRRCPVEEHHKTTENLKNIALNKTESCNMSTQATNVSEIIHDDCVKHVIYHHNITATLNDAEHDEKQLYDLTNHDKTINTTITDSCANQNEEKHNNTINLDESVPNDEQSYNETTLDKHLFMTINENCSGQVEKQNKEIIDIKDIIILQKESSSASYDETDNHCFGPVEKIEIQTEKPKDNIKRENPDKYTEESINECNLSIDEMVDNKEKSALIGNEGTAETIFNKYLTLIGDSKVLESAVEYEDPEAGTCYVIPIIEKSSNTDIASIENTEVIAAMIQDIVNKKQVTEIYHSPPSTKISVSNGNKHQVKDCDDIEAKLAKIVGEDSIDAEVQNPNKRLEVYSLEMPETEDNLDVKYKTEYRFDVEVVSGSETDSEDVIQQSTEIKDQDYTDQKTLDDESLTRSSKRLCKYNGKDMTTEANTENFNVIIPMHTYARGIENIKQRKNLKRRVDMSDMKTSEKKYRKGKNIDYPKITAVAMTNSGYTREYKCLIDYCSSVKFSYSVPFHKEHIDVHNTLKSWPIQNSSSMAADDSTEAVTLFTEIEKSEALLDPLKQTLSDEIVSQYNENSYTPSKIDETNFNMGFGEGSGRVIQKSIDGEHTTFSAATLSDVKQLQPLLPSDEPEVLIKRKEIRNEHQNQLIKTKHFVDVLNLREKVRSFFKKTKDELKLDLVQKHKKDVFEDSNSDWPFGDLQSPTFIQPSPFEMTVNVVQVGQLPVSGAAQNPVTCDPRVTHVSNISPQCSPENSSSDELQTAIKTEYTELTTANITLPLMQEYAQHQHAMPNESQEANIIYGANDTNLTSTQIKSVVKIELMEETSQETVDDNMDYEYENLQQLSNGNVNNDLQYHFNNNANNMTAEPDSNPEIVSSLKKTKPASRFTEDKQNKDTPDKSDQIAHAMNAAGISATQVTHKPSDLAPIDSIAQNAQSHVVTTSQANTNNYSKSTPMNALALQQALAQILPPPLNHTNIPENNQQTSSNPQVLHIVQGNNGQSVINKQNGTQVLHIVQNKSVPTSNGTPTSQQNTFNGLSLVDGAIQQNGNQLLHIVNTGNQKNSNASQLLKRVNLLTNLANVQGSNEQKMVQFVCKSADGKPIQLPHQRSMVLRLQPLDPPSVTNTAKHNEAPDLAPSSSTAHSVNDKESNAQEMKSRSLYEENYAKFVQNGDPKPSQEKATSLPKFNQVFGKQVYQDKQNEIGAENLSENSECPQEENNVQLDQINDIGSPPMLIRKPQAQPSQVQPNLVQQIKQTIGPSNIQTMHGGVIYTRQIPVNLGNGQTINLITVPSTEMVDDSTQKQKTDGKFGNQEADPPVIKIVPTNQPANTTNGTTEENNAQMRSTNEANSQHNPQPQPVLTQMRIKLPMLSKAPQMVGGTRVVRPAFFQIQRNVIGGANQQVYQQLVLTAAPPLGQSIRLPAQAQKPKTPSETQSSPESQMSSSTLEQLREFDMVLEQVKERSTVQPGSSTSSTNSSFAKSKTPDTTDAPTPSTSTQESTTPVLYSVGNTQPLNMVNYVNRKSTITSTTTSSYVRSPDSTGVSESPSSSSNAQIPPAVTAESCASTSCSSEAAAATPAQPKPKKKKSKPSTSNSNPFNIKNTPKPSTQKPLEDEQTTQRILYILAEYKEQVENSPDKDKPAPRRRNNPAAPNAAGSSKRKKSSSGSRRRDMSPVVGEESCRTMGSEDSSCGTSPGGECNECLETHSPEESPKKVVRRLTFEQETHTQITQTRTIPQRNVIVTDGQAFAVRGAAGKPATTVLMPANYLLPVSMMKGGQQIAIVTNRGPKLLVGAGEGGAGGTLLFQRLIGPGGLKPVLARPGVRHIRLPTAALHNLQAFNIASPAATAQPPDSTASPAPAPTPPDLVDTRAMSSPWPDRDAGEVKPERGNSSPEGSEPWNLPSSSIADDYGYEEIVRTDNMDRTVLDAIPDRYSPDMEAQRIFDKMFDSDSKKSMYDSRCGYDIDASDDDKAYHQVVQRKDGRHTRLTHVSAAALRHKYAILEHELRLQKSLSEECEDLGVDSPSASELFPEAELLFAPSPAHEQTIDQCHTPQPTILSQGIPQDLDDQIASDHLLTHRERHDDLDINLDDVGEIVTVGEDGMTMIPLDHEEFARSHPNTTFHSEPEDGEIPPFTIAQAIKGRQVSYHSRGVPGTVVMAPQTTVISQATVDSVQNTVKFSDIDNMINAMPSPQHLHNINMPSVLVKDNNEGLTKFDRLLNESRELHLSNTASAIVHSTGNGTQVIRRVHYESRRDARYLVEDRDTMIAGDAKPPPNDRRDMQLGEDVSPSERHSDLFWESNAPVRPERRRYEFSSDSDKCCKSPYDEANSDSSGIGVHTRLDTVIKAARTERRRSDGSSADDSHPPLRTYPPKRTHQAHAHHHDAERGGAGKTRASERCHDAKDESRRRASNRGVVKRGCHCCNGSTAPPKPKKSRPKKPSDYHSHN